MKKIILLAICCILTAISALAAPGDKTPVNRLAHGAPVSGSACVQGTQRNTAKFVFTCMTSGVWKHYSSAAY